VTSATSSLTGKRLRSEREKRGMSVEELSFRAGVSYKTIERVEAGESTPRRATVAVIQQAFAAADAEGAAA
jgi:transcriptional regulator with XRE-family HTH domain